MIRYLTNDKIDKKKWDNAIHHSFNGNVYAYSWYLDKVHYGWEALVENNYERVMPLTGNSKFSYKYIFPPFFTQQLGVFSTSVLSPDDVTRFILNIPSKYKYFQINLNIHNHPELPYPFKVSSNKNYLLDMINDYQKMIAHFSSNTKRNLKKGLDKKLYVSQNVKPEIIIKLFRENKGKKIKHWKKEHYMRLQSLMYISIYKGVGTSYGVYTKENNLCAAGFFLYANQHLVFLFSGRNNFALDSGATTVLINHVLKKYAGSNMILDFEGSNDEGLARFYSGFGAKPVTYSTVELNRLPFPVNVFLDVKNKIKFI